MKQPQRTETPQTPAPLVNGAPTPGVAPAPANPAEAMPDKTTMIHVSKRTANALRMGIEQANAAAAAVRVAEERLQQSRQALQSIAGTNQGYFLALIEDAGKKPEDFANFGIWEQDGEFYIRATPQGQ
jgi:hypothetical protein